MFTSLDRTDIEIAPVDGRPRVLQTDHREAEKIEATRELSTVFALLRVLYPRRFTKPEPIVIYSIPTTPPDFLIEAVVSAGGRLCVGHDPRSWLDITDSPLVAPPRPPVEIAREALAALARRTAAEAGLSLDRKGLESFEQKSLPEPYIDEYEDEIIEGKYEDTSEEAKWTRIIKLASYAGEVLKPHLEGRWIIDMGSPQALPLFYECDVGDRETTVNLLGKAMKFNETGMEDSVMFLVTTLLSMAQTEGAKRSP